MTAVMAEDFYRYRAAIPRPRYPSLYDMVAKAKLPKAKRRVMSALNRIAEDLVTKGVPIPVDMLRGIEEEQEANVKEASISIFIGKDSHPGVYAFVRAQPKRKAAEALLNLLDMAAKAYLQDSQALVAAMSSKTSIEAMVAVASAAGTLEHIDMDEKTRDDDALTAGLDQWDDPAFLSIGGDPGNLA